MSLYEIFFEMEMSISEKFPNLSPFEVRQKRANEVFLIVNRLNNYLKYQNKESGKKKVIRKPAGDDWF